MRSCVVMSRRSWTLLLIVAGVWGGSFMLTAIAIRDLPVPVVALFRTGVGAVSHRPADYSSHHRRTVHSGDTGPCPAPSA